MFLGCQPVAQLDAFLQAEQAYISQCFDTWRELLLVPLLLPLGDFHSRVAQVDHSLFQPAVPLPVDVRHLNCRMVCDLSDGISCALNMLVFHAFYFNAIFSAPSPSPSAFYCPFSSPVPPLLWVPGAAGHRAQALEPTPRC